MRVIAGEARGRTLKAPRGVETRPTSDLLRGALFSMLDAMGYRPSRVLDLYAGSGALGIEALSRGAESATFVERSSIACSIIRGNLDRAGFSERGQICCLPVAKAMGRLAGPYDLILVDPPYEDRGFERTFSSSSAATLLGEDSLLIYEHSRRDSPPAELGPLSLLRTRSHGSSSVSFYRRSTGSGPSQTPYD